MGDNLEPPKARVRKKLCREIMRGAIADRTRTAACSFAPSVARKSAIQNIILYIKQARQQTSEQASKRERKQASERASKQVSKQETKQQSEPASKKQSKQERKQARKQARKKARKKAGKKETETHLVPRDVHRESSRRAVVERQPLAVIRYPVTVGHLERYI